MAAPEQQRNDRNWKKALLALFILLAAAGIIIGAIAGAMPDKFHKAKSSVTTADAPVSTASSANADEEAAGTTTPVASITKDQQPSASTGNLAPISGSTGSTTGSTTGGKGTTTTTTPTTGTTTGSTSTTTGGKGTTTSTTPTTTTTTTTGGATKPLGSLSSATLGTGNNVIGGAVSQVLGGQATSLAGGNTVSSAGSGSTTLINSVVRSEFQNLASSTGACAAGTGEEFVAQMLDEECIIITLTPGVTYDIGEDEILVTSRKVVIGNPLFLPTLDGQNAPRIFRVMPGGYLDLRYVRTYRGGGELIATIPVLRGGSVLIELGGTGTFLGVIFTNANPPNPAILIAPNLSRAVRVFGGQIYVAGGVATVTLCHFWVMQPGVLLREIYLMGAEILLGAGVLVVSGSTFTNSQIFLNVLGSAAFIAQLGGTLVCSGVTFTLNVGIIHASGAGILTFMGGGVAIHSGVTWNANLGALAHFGTGIFFFNGGGVLVISGSAQSAALGVSIACGAGGLLSLGGGVAVYSGMAQSFVSGASFLAEAGVINWMGGGSQTATGCSIARTIGVSGIYGIGGSFGSGGGSMVNVGCPSADTYGSTSIAAVGGDFFLGTGLLIDVGNPYAKTIGAGFLALLGVHSFVGVGGALDYGSPFINGLTPAVYLSPPVFLNFIRGQEFTGTWSARRLQSGNGSAEDPVAAYNLMKPTTVQQVTNNNFLKAISGSGDAANIDFKQASVEGNTVCNICGNIDDVAGKVVGDKAGSCTNDQKLCTLDTALTPTGAPLDSWISDAVKLQGTGKLIDTNIITSVFKVGCNSAVDGAAASLTSCASKDTLKDAVKDGLADDCAKVVIVPRIIPTGVPELEDMDTSIADSLANSDLTDTFDVLFATHNPECTTKVKNFLSSNSDSPGSLTETLNGLTDRAAVINDASVQYVTTHFAKGMDVSTAAKNVVPNAIKASDVSLTPTVLVTADSRLAQPQFKSTDTATVALTNFLDGKDVKLGFTTDCGLTSTITPVYTTKFTDTNNDNIMLVDVPLASAPLAAGKAFTQLALVAEQAGLRWCSQPIVVSSA